LSNLPKSNTIETVDPSFRPVKVCYDIHLQYAAPQNTARPGRLWFRLPRPAGINAQGHRCRPDQPACSQPAVPAPAHASRQTHHFCVHAGRAQPRRFLRLQTRIDRSSRPEYRLHWRTLRRLRQSHAAETHEATLEIPPRWPVRQTCLRPVSGNSSACRRSLFSAWAAHRRGRSRTSHTVSAHRCHCAGPPLAGFVGTVRAWFREQRPAGIHFPDALRCQRRTTQFQQRLSAHRLSGHTHRSRSVGRWPDDHRPHPQSAPVASAAATPIQPHTAAECHPGRGGPTGTG